MTSEPIIPKESALVEISSDTNDLVEREMHGESDELKRETKALIDALKKRAQSEANAAGNLTRDTYLNAVRSARESIEQHKLVDRERIAYSIKLIQMDAEKNWESIVKEISTLGDRLADAAKAAWEALTAPRHDSKDSNK
jgi:hypothetical protein